MGVTDKFSDLAAKVIQQFHTKQVVELSSITWEERILPILSQLKSETVLLNSWTYYILKDLKELSALRRLKDYPDETDSQELLESWAGICVEEKSLVILNPSNW